jgi:site-specific recombinase XerD
LSAPKFKPGAACKPFALAQSPVGRWLNVASAQTGYSDSGLHALVVRWAKRFAVASDGTVDLRRLTAHVLRHTFVTFALEDGAAPTAVQATAGHASLATTAIYSHAQDDFRRREVAKTFVSK